MLEAPKLPLNSSQPWFCWSMEPTGEILLRGPCGHIASLGKNTGSPDEHSIAADGTVSPSVECPRKGCTFHESVRLLDWVPK